MSQTNWTVSVVGTPNPEGLAEVVDAIDEHAMQVGVEVMRIQNIRLADEPAESVAAHMTKAVPNE